MVLINNPASLNHRLTSSSVEGAKSYRPLLYEVHHLGAGGVGPTCGADTISVGVGVVVVGL